MSSPQSLPVLSQREALHDLRILFGVVASAAGRKPVELAGRVDATPSHQAAAAAQPI